MHINGIFKVSQHRTVVVDIMNKIRISFKTLASNRHFGPKLVH